MKKLNKLQEHSGDAMISRAKLVHRKSTLPKRLKFPKRTRQVLEPKDSVNETKHHWRIQQVGWKRINGMEDRTVEVIKVEEREN